MSDNSGNVEETEPPLAGWLALILEDYRSDLL